MILFLIFFVAAMSSNFQTTIEACEDSSSMPAIPPLTSFSELSLASTSRNLPPSIVSSVSRQSTRDSVKQVCKKSTAPQQVRISKALSEYPFDKSIYYKENGVITAYVTWEGTILRGNRLVNFDETLGKEISKEEFLTMVEEQGIRTIEELEGEAEEELRKNPFLYECLYCQRAMTSLNKILAHVGVNKNHSGKNKRNLRVDCSVRRVEEGISSASIPPEDYTYPKRYPYLKYIIRDGVILSSEKKKSLIENFNKHHVQK